ncbi:50S ribosomal protein L31e [Caldivirga maquilingensis]|uniref:Large ribosomal subunit protein eL31 n=1 Tax=Caldivirga maquilingensis (strain ATCC 700844 / DSM 13496 / JCM 10307 / IC-167) TaxID=397948 RepID=A8MAL4_CALMQ|nr:50S ribosomal protein L31e [Caldivirga maquilingensis]ABW01050.1 Ribosomal protein L31e [Caldivirga maquilingensis IC-167]
MSSNEIILTINLRDVKEASRRIRAPYAARFIKRIIARYVKVDEDKVKLNENLNNLLWSRGIQKPPSRIKVKVTKREDGSVLVEYQG